MKRNLPWGLIAAFPSVAIVIAANFADDIERALAGLAFVQLYWFLMLGVVIGIQLLYFAVHAARNQALTHTQRMVWVVLHFFFAPLASIAYWWFAPISAGTAGSSPRRTAAD